jgi:hypothetical protein
MYEELEIAEYDFESLSYKILPGVQNYHCTIHNTDIECNYAFSTEVGIRNSNVDTKDICIEENRFYKYQIIKPKGERCTSRVVFLFHGFNEKDWGKYVPWAEAICKKTGFSVVLFPIAFHMQRAPKGWSSKREMFELSEMRKRSYPNVVHSTLSNVAISIRLHSMPQRFIWSGLQTYYDVIQLIEECKEGRHPYISKNFELDIFAYSIGGFLAQILKLSNYNNYFSNSKVCLFCSGATFNRLSPVSKFILDSEANIALYSFLIEHFDSILQKDNLLHHYIVEHFEGQVFQSMLNFQKMRDFREGLLKKYEDQIYAITLKKDLVIPSFEVINTLKGAYRTININVEELDFDREYIHENPFNTDSTASQQGDEDFELVFNKVSGFFSKGNL